MLKTLTRLLILSFALPACGYGDLFFFPALSTSSMGTAYANSASGTEDITQQFYNPAVLPFFHEPEAGVVGSVIFPRDTFTDGIALTEDNTVLALDGSIKEFAQDIGGGGFYGLLPMPRHIYLGLAVTTPWRRKQTYAGDWFGRYYGTRLEMMSTNIAPSIAFHIRDVLAVSVAAQVDYLNVKYEEAIDFGSIADSLGIMGASPGNQDGFFKLNTGDWSYGYVVGVIMKPCHYIRLGASIRSSVKHNFHFIPQYTLGNIGESVVAETGFYNPQADASMEINTPRMIVAGIHYQHDCQCELMASTIWKSWSDTNGIRVKFALRDQPDLVIVKDGWRDTFGIAVGGKYYNPLRTWYVRIGAMYEENPVPSEATQTPLFYGEETAAIAAGIGWNFCQCAYFDIAWDHTFSRDPKINQVLTDEGNAFRGDLSGKIQTMSDTISFSFVAVF